MRMSIFVSLLLFASFLSLNNAQPFVSPQFASLPVSEGNNNRGPTKLSQSRIAGIVTVAVLFVALVILAIVICTHKQKKKDIDLSKPLNLDSEAKKKKKKKKNETTDPSQQVELEPLSTQNSAILEIPDRKTKQKPIQESESESSFESQTSKHSEENKLLDV